MKNKLIYYLAHPYEGDEERSYSQAIIWKSMLYQMNLHSFSPILNNHKPNLYMKTLDMKIPNYIEEDLLIMEKMMNHDGGFSSYKCKVPGCNSLTCRMKKHKRERTYRYDSGVILLMSKTAIKKPNDTPFGYTNIGLTYTAYKTHKNKVTWQNGVWEAYWNSQGCRIEYEFAVENYIKVLELESFIEIGVEILLSPQKIS